MKHHIVSVKIYLAVFSALLVLTGLTVYVATIDFGIMNDVVAMSIAVFKMLLVALIFMHLKYSAKLLWLVASAGLIWLVVMFAITLSDYRTRDWLEGAQPWSEVPVAEEVVESGEHH